MKFSKYVEEEMKRTGESKTKCLRRLAAKADMSLLTLQNVEKGGKLVRYDKATALSKITGGKVSITEICEGDG